ncbi:TIR domain-containing protein [Kineococcus sp. R86509]|uniref:TIR domain-containing protein n=1 Tax=Kineococcus sp. R86509 TaxID=3093851 RepID=UPI0036D27B99
MLWTVFSLDDTAESYAAAVSEWLPRLLPDVAVRRAGLIDSQSNALLSRLRQKQKDSQVSVVFVSNINRWSSSAANAILGVPQDAFFIMQVDTERPLSSLGKAATTLRSQGVRVLAASVDGWISLLQEVLSDADLGKAVKRIAEIPPPYIKTTLARTQAAIEPPKDGGGNDKLQLILSAVSELQSQVSQLVKRQYVPSSSVVTDIPSDAPVSAFVASSREGLDVATAVAQQLNRVVECELWTNAFTLSQTTIDDLARQANLHDFAIIIATADDFGVKRGRQIETPRDNVLFEAGLFIGSMGRERVFILVPRDERPELPTDLLGVTVGDFSRPKTSVSLTSAVLGFTADVEAAVKTLGPRQRR